MTVGTPPGSASSRPSSRRRIGTLIAGLLTLFTSAALVISPSIASAAEPGSDADHPVVMYLAEGQGYTGKTQAELEEQARTQFATMSKYWLEQSRGKVDFRLESVSWNPDQVSCGATGTAQNARQAAGQAAVGFQTAPRRHFLYAVIAGCPFLGNGTAGQSLNDSNRNVYLEQNQPENGMWVHEFGHNLSLGHASTLYCPNNAVDCNSVAEGGDGQAPTYADGVDTMASSYASIIKGFSTPNAIRLGFLGADGYVNITGDTTQTVTIESRDILDQDGQPRSVRITDPISNRTFYVELASRDTYDAPIWWGGRPADITTVNGDQYQFDFGVRILRFQAPEGATYQNTFLLPSPRNADGVRRVVWDQGKTFTSASGGTTVEVASVTRTTATLNIRTRADVVAPDAPTALTSDGTTVTGTAEPGSTVAVTAPDGTSLGTATADQTTGAFTVTLTAQQAVGTTLNVTATDAAGNTSAAAQVTVTAPDPAAPDAPTALTSNGSTVTGTAEPGSAVIVTNSDGTEVGRTTADGTDGAFTVRLSPRQADGAQLTVVARNASGATSDAATVTVVAPPTNLPTPPNSLSSDGSTVTGVAEPGRTIVVRTAGGTELGTATADAATGAFTVTLTSPQADGTRLSVVARDADGNESTPATVTVTVPQAGAPDAPKNLASDGSRISGTAAPGVSIRVTGPDGTVLGTGTAGSDGVFNIALSPRQARGAQLTVVAIGADGVVSAAATVAVTAAAVPVPPTPTPTPTPTPSPTADPTAGTQPGNGNAGNGEAGDGALAWTGADLGVLPIGAALAVAFGAVLLIASRRRRHAPRIDENE